MPERDERSTNENSVNPGQDAQGGQGVGGMNISQRQSEMQSYVENMYPGVKQQVPVTGSSWSIPGAVSEFLGREQEVEHILGELDKNKRGVLITGVGGIGKGEFSRYLAFKLRDKYPDGCEIDLGGAGEMPLTPHEAMELILHSLIGFEAKLPEDKRKLEMLYWSVLNQKRAVIILEHAVDESQVQKLIGAPTCMFLVTARKYFPMRGLMHHRLQELGPEAAQRLLLDLCPRIGDDAAEIAALVGYLPIALLIVGSYLSAYENKDVKKYKEALRMRRLEILSRNPNADFNVQLAFEESYQQLKPVEQMVWRILGVFPDIFTVSAAAYVWGGDIDEDRAEDILGQLGLYSLVKYTSGEYELLTLLRDFARGKWSEEEKRQAEQRYREYSTRQE